MAKYKAYDITIIGGGIIGSATAYYLTKNDNRVKVAIIERDPTYARASSTLSMANARIQFSLKENILISRYALNILENFAEEMISYGNRPNIAYHREGNLFLLDEAGKKPALKALDLQRKVGGQVEWWSAEKIKQVYSLYETAGLAGGIFGSQDGHFDAYSFLKAYKAKARSQGAEYVNGEVVAIDVNNKSAAGVKLSSGERLSSGYVINCAGAWAAEIARTTGISLPVVPVKRQVFVLDPAIKPKSPLPLTVLPSGLYFRSETGGLILVGKSMKEDPIGFDFAWDQKRFLDHLWFELVGFVPAFDSIKLVRGWSGLYAENTLDGNAILGEWPELKAFYLANGFSGHGLQQAPAVGRYISELIFKQKPTLDLSAFGPDRIINGLPLSEAGLV